MRCRDCVYMQGSNVVIVVMNELMLEIHLMYNLKNICSLHVNMVFPSQYLHFKLQLSFFTCCKTV